MPGIADKSALRNAILDSLSVSGASIYRLRSRGVFDPHKAVRLRNKEYDLLKCLNGSSCENLLNSSKEAIKEGRTGNHYVYKALYAFTGLLKERKFLESCRSRRVTDAMELGSLLLAVKAPEYEFAKASLSIPEGYDKIHCMYISLRTLIDILMTMYSDSGKYRGNLQRINTRSKTKTDFDKNIQEFLDKEREVWKKSGRKDLHTASHTIEGVLSMSMVRLSDVNYLRINIKGEITDVLMTANHFERLVHTIKKVSNVLLGTLLAYGMDDLLRFNFVEENLLGYIKKLFRLGIKDDLAVGEAGKAVTDLLKAKLSQTDELPWNNRRMLMKTYSEERQKNAEDLWDEFYHRQVDPDILINTSYVWKLALQPDSDLRSDFKDLVSGLSKPNPVSKDAPLIMELAIKRAVLVGALRENRPVEVKPYEGCKVPSEITNLIAHSSPSERDFRHITYGMLKDISVRIKGSFPNVHDVRHLMFKDKSSSISNVSLRANIKKKTLMQNEAMEKEDDLIMKNAEKSAEDFFKSIKPEMTDYEIDWKMRSTANDILSSLDESIASVFREAEKKFKLITKTMERVRMTYGTARYHDELRKWMEEYPELMINTATEPKYGEIHKRSVRIFYMFEKEMKTYLSQFERMARLLGYYIKGAEIVKGDRAREQHMNVLSSAHRAAEEGVLAYQILFDLSKFSQKFNHLIIDAAAKVISEMLDYEPYAHISDLFKASFLYVSSRNVDESFTGVLGAFEGFLNFLWTNIHATVMDVALKNCGRAGDLAAYSDDGLLMFTMESKPHDPHEKIQAELMSVINSITKTYKDFGLDFNLGKTLISRTLAEFLGVIMYEGRRFPVWMKELCKLGVPDENKIVSSISQDITDVSAQIAATIKAGMPPHQASLLGYFEIMNGPVRRVWGMVKSATSERSFTNLPEIREILLLIFLSLNASFGGVRVPDPINMMVTSDFDPISEMIRDLESIQRIFPKFRGLRRFILSKVKSSSDYLSLMLGSAPVHTSDISYYAGLVKSEIIKRVRDQISVPENHPLSKGSVPSLHQSLENISNLHLPSVNALVRYAIPVIEYDRKTAPSRSSSVAKLLKKYQLRSIQSKDSKAVMSQLKDICSFLEDGSPETLPRAQEIYQKSYPNLNLAMPMPSLRDLVFTRSTYSECSYRIYYKQLERLDDKGSYRLLNRAYSDDLVPPLVTTDVNIKHLVNAPDVITHCTRGIYNELISSSAQGHDISLIAYEVCKINKAMVSMPAILTRLRDLRKVAVANRKKHIHRVFWSEPTKSSIIMERQGALNYVMTQTSDVHYSVIITAALALAHYLSTSSKAVKAKQVFYEHVDAELASQTRLTPMKIIDERFSVRNQRDFELDPTFSQNEQEAIRNEVLRTIEQTRQELTDNLLTGRMGMIPDLQSVSGCSSVIDPLRYAMVWSLTSKLDALAAGEIGVPGVSSSRISGYSLSNIPMEVANLAMIYRSYKNVRKADLGKYMKTLQGKEGDVDRSKSSKLLPPEIAKETVDLADSLGLYHSMTPDKLMSIHSTISYNSILIARGINLIYYSLDSASETSSVEKISPARAKAMQKVVNAIISGTFETKEYSAKSDTEKIILMGISGSMRGSIHRDRPFNYNTFSRWINRFCEVIYSFYKDLDPKYTTPKKIRDNDYHDYEGLTSHLREKLEAQLRRTKGIDIKFGTPDQFDQLIKFLLNLASWGAIPNLINFGFWEYIAEKFMELYEDMVKPALMMVRTVSYSSVEKASSNYIINAAETESSTDLLNLDIEAITTNITGNETLNNLLAEPPMDSYRSRAGPFAHLAINIKFSDYPNDYYGLSLAYSISLPLLLSSGQSSYKSVIYLGKGSEYYVPADVIRALQSYSLPPDPDTSQLNLGVITGLSESALKTKIHSFLKSVRRNRMIVLEIPPDATAFSLGIIQWMTNQKLSYATTAMSSDAQGTSIYVVAIIEDDLPSVVPKPDSSNPEVRSLGDSSLHCYINQILLGNYHLMSTLLLSPLHQVGIPVYADIVINGIAIHLSVEEELLDRHRVSFVETGRPSETSLVMARIDSEKVAWIIRALRSLRSENTPSVNAFSAGYYYLHAMFPTIDPEELRCFLRDMMNDAADDERDIIVQQRILAHICSPVIALPRIETSSMPAEAQILEPDLPIVNLDDVEFWEETDEFARSAISGRGKSILRDEEVNLLLAYISNNKRKLDHKAMVSMIRGKISRRKYKGPRKMSLNEAPERTGGHHLDTMARSSITDEGAESNLPPDIAETQEMFRNAFSPAVIETMEKDEEAIEDDFSMLCAQLAMEGFTERDVDLLFDLPLAKKKELLSMDVSSITSMLDDFLQAYRYEKAKEASSGVM